MHRKLWMSFRKNLFLLLNKRYRVKNINGIAYLLDIRNRVDRHIDAFSVYEKDQLVFLFSKLKEINCECFVDIGAHWGHYSLSFSKDDCFKNAEMHAFEPDKINRYQLYANLFLNDLQDRVSVYEYAISNNEGELKFHHFSDNNRGRSCIADDGEITIQAKKLDSVLRLKNKSIGIKVDVEGHELDAVSGMKEILRNNICVIQIESFDDVLPELIEKMSTYGYVKIETIDSDHFFSNKK
ncbi:MAG: FkbM family methyltransferase [Pseudomonadota bacterium]